MATKPLTRLPSAYAGRLPAPQCLGLLFSFHGKCDPGSGQPGTFHSERVLRWDKTNPKCRGIRDKGLEPSSFFHTQQYFEKL